jgi:hypothetical protein
MKLVSEFSWWPVFKSRVAYFGQHQVLGVLAPFARAWPLLGFAVVLFGILIKVIPPKLGGLKTHAPVLGAIALSAAVCFAGASGALAAPTKTTDSNVNAAPAKMTVVAQRCRCIKRRWNGSCQMKVCRDRW